MNLLLVTPDELAADGTITLTDRRATHLRDVLGATPGQVVRIGVTRGQLGTATVLTDDARAITLRVELTAAASAPLPIDLVLAVPRPKVLSRTLEIAAAFGVDRIDLTNAWRVDKSYLASPRLAPAALHQAARLGAEQGATTHLPDITVHRRLMGLLDERWPAGAPAAPGTRIVFHPGAPPLEAVPLTGPITLAIGPEGGWIPREVDTLVERGFVTATIGAPILRVEAAVAAALGQLLLLLRSPRA